MQVFMSGATGYIGSVLVEKLQAAGHDVSGLARSDESARKLRDRDISVVKGSLADTDVIEKAARSADAVVHLAIEFSDRAATLDRAFVDAVLRAMQGSGLPFIYSSGIWVIGPTGDQVADERVTPNPLSVVAWRPAHEQLVLASDAVRGVVIRSAMVYGRDGGRFGAMRRKAEEQGYVELVGTGGNRVPLVHVDDVADLYVLALNAKAGSLYIGAAGKALPLQQLASASVGGGEIRYLPLDEARQKMGPLAEALVLDQQVSSRKAMGELGWRPSHTSVLDELAAGS